MTKMYKGFNKDMTCRGFQFKEGKTYETDTAKLCESGFHACENPLDCFGYYAPANSVFHEVELDATDETHSDDTKRVGKKIKIGARLDVAGICKAHFEYVKERTTNDRRAQDRSSLSAQDGSSLSAQDRSSLSARNYSSLSAQDYSSLSAQDGSSLSARNYSSLSAQDYSSLSAQDYSSLSARNRSSLSARNCSSLSARNYSSLSARNYSSLSAQDRSSLSARNRSSLSAQDGSSLSAQDRSSLIAGKSSVLAAFNSKAKAGIGSLIALARREWSIDGGYKIVDFAAAIVDGERIKADTWYVCKNGELIEWEEGTDED